MRDKWYADNRDLVKWSVLLTLAERHAAKHILQILYYRPTEWAQIELDGEQVPIPAAVIQHFRMAAAAEAIRASAPIEVLTDAFLNRGSRMTLFSPGSGRARRAGRAGARPRGAHRR